MTDIANDISLPYDRDSVSWQEKIATLQERFEVLGTQNEKMCDKLLDMSAENNKYQQKLECLTHENEKLKQSPLFIATIQKIIDKGVIVKQHDNSQKALIEVTDEMCEELESDARVAVNDSFSIAKRLDEETDVRVYMTQVEHSPDVTCEDIGSLEEQMQEVREAVEIPLDRPEMLAEVDIDPPPGMLPYGPPGTGKTMLAKTVANQTNASFIKTAGSELAYKFISEGAKLVHDLFEVVCESEPAVTFIDEIGTIASKRMDSKTPGDAEVQRTTVQLLTKMDGFDERGNIRVIAATSRLDMLDPAILYPDRFDCLIEVPKPNEDGREIIFQVHTQKMNISDDVNFVEPAGMADNAFDADIKVVYMEAGVFAIRGDRMGVFMQDFVDAQEKVQQEVSDEIEASRAFV